MLMRRAGKREQSASTQGVLPDWLGIAGLCLVAFALRCIGTEGRPFENDELYHVLAGHSWAVGHGVSIAGGEYLRVRLYTIATGISVEFFGGSPLAVRLPAIIAGTLQVWASFVWVRAVAGRRAAWTAALLVCFSFRLIDLSQLARFYSWHVLAIWIFATQVYALVGSWAMLGTGERIVRTMVATAALGLALYIQTTTVIAAIAIGLWAAPVLARSLGFHRWSRGLWLSAGLGLAVMLVAVAVAGGALLAAIREFRHVALWAEAGGNRPTFYYSPLANSYGWLLHLLPIAALLAYRKWSRPTWFCMVIVVVGLFLHSFAGMKSDRYISYLDPFILSIWAMATASLLAPIRELVALPFRSLPDRLAMLLAVAVTAVAASSAVVGVPMYRATLSEVLRLARGEPPFANPDQADNESVDWTPYMAKLRPLTHASMLVTADDLRALRYLGGFDLLLNRTVMWDFTQVEFGVDPRTGAHGITSAPSLAAVMDCYPSGAILVSNRRWRSQDVTASAADFIERTAKPVPLPAGLRMRAFTWRGPDRRETPACQALSRQIGDRRQRMGERLVRLR